MNLFDTADVYGGPQTADMAKGYGVSEETMGRWLKRGGRRDDIVLATKVYQPMGLGPNDRRLSAYHIRRACEASLRRLQTESVRAQAHSARPRMHTWSTPRDALDGLHGPSTLRDDLTRRVAHLEQ
ncbi:aldo/keto reductase [Streptomyces europaeiscabiei]|uniref:aldo/keto reductase n=1 Tax=Streptomyces europaeiscabiei TaxID=146819 RepID=UPI0038F700C6